MKKTNTQKYRDTVPLNISWLYAGICTYKYSYGTGLDTAGYCHLLALRSPQGGWCQRIHTHRRNLQLFRRGIPPIDKN